MTRIQSTIGGVPLDSVFNRLDFISRLKEYSEKEHLQHIEKDLPEEFHDTKVSIKYIKNRRVKFIL